MIQELFLASSLAVSATSEGTPPGRGSFELISSNPESEITCLMDEPCVYETEITATNRTGQPLYGTTWYTDRGLGVQFRGFDGEWTSEQSETDQAIQPGGQVRTEVRFSPSQRLGITIGTIYIDGRMCNISFPEPDCVAYGGSHRIFTINKVAP